MKNSIALLLILFATPLAAALPDSLPEYSRIYDPARDAFQDGHAAIKLAKETRRRILIEVGGDWCKWCHILDEFLNSNPEIKAELHQKFVMLKINVSDENSNEKFLRAFPKPLGYPHMYVTENNGNIVLSKDTADFLVNGKYSRQRFLDFFQRWATKEVNK